MVPAIAASCLHPRTGNTAMHLTPARLTKPICPGRQCIFKMRLCEGFMIDHISVAVRDLVIAERFYTAVLTPLGLFKVRDLPDAAIGFGKKYPEFWINKREAMARVADDSGVHICLRAPDVPSVDAFHAAALKAGGASDGDPAVRMHYDEGYYAAFIRDPDGNRIEAVRFLRSRV